MKLISKAKSLFDGGKKGHPFDRKATDLLDDGRNKDPLSQNAMEDLIDGGRNKDPLSQNAIEDLIDHVRNGQNAIEDLIDHVRNGDVDYIKTVDPNILLKARDEDGNTVLMLATKMGNLNLCKKILEKGPSLLYHQNNYNRTVLHHAIDSFISCEKILFIDFFVNVSVDDLETNKGDINLNFKRWMKMQDLEGDTALIIAASYGDLHVVKRLVEVDREYNLGLSKVVGDKGNTALDWAVEKKDHEMVKLLTDDEVGPYSDDFIPYSTAMDLFQHVRNGDLDYIKTVQLNVLLHSRDQHRMSVLSIATKCDKLDCCKAILKRCPSLLYHHNNDRWSVLHYAAYQKYYRLIDFYVSVGLEAEKRKFGNMIRFKKWINLQNRGDCDTALILAVIKGSHDIVKRFVEVDHQYKLGLSKIIGSNRKTALQWASYHGNHEMIKMLTGGGDPNLDSGANSDDDDFPISIAMQQTQESLQTGNSSGTGVVSESNIFTFTDVSKHNNLKDCWPLINDKAYYVTKFPGDHPGCDEILLKATGKDATTDFQKVQCHNGNAVTMMDKFNVGVCDSITSSLNKLASDKPQPYSRMQLKEFTEDFSQLLGSGGFGDVYKGRFPDGGVFIAVKVLKSIGSMEEVMEKQFVAEVDTIGRAYHRNLIKLHGYCYEPNTKFKALVFDYMENGSFDTYLFKKKLDISWAELHNIAKQIAQGISYLHESCSPQIIHQDIKPSNVLLDANHFPKVADFGLAKVVNVGESEFEQTKIKGSRNYMAPEVNQLNKVKLSCKVDVYSFGMMLFDILGSKRNHVDNKGWFPGQVWKKYDTYHFDKFILECGIKEKDKENAKRLATIAFLCVEHNPRARPMLSNVVTMLEGKIELGKPIAPFYPNYSSNESSLMSDSRDYSKNESSRGNKVSGRFQFELLVLVGCRRQVLVRCSIFVMLMLVFVLCIRVILYTV